MTAVGILLVVALGGLYAAGIRAILQVPFRALGILVGGMAFHNIVLMILLRLGTPDFLVRVVQAWKEGIVLLLFLLVARVASDGWRAGRRPRLAFIDWLVVAFTLVVIVYFFLPSRVFGVTITFSQRLVGLRLDLLLPALYLFGRVFWTNRRADLEWVFAAIVGSAAVVGLVGAIELWLIPTQFWLDAGVNRLSSWLGFAYQGPRGLPENFFQTSAEGWLLRRAVSTYVSPLGIAYPGLLVVPLAVAFAARRWQSARDGVIAISLLALTVVGVLFSLTRLALVLMAVEIGLLALFLRRAWLFAATGVVAAAVLFMLYLYPQVGPLLTRDLSPVQHRGTVHIVTRGDPSLQEHAGLLGYDFVYVRQHPLGTGLGSAVHRFGASQGTGESAVFDFFGELGVVGGTLYLPTYFLMTMAGMRALVRARSDVLLSGLPLVASIGGLMLFLITLTSDVWGNFAVTFLFWWAAGYSVSLLTRPANVALQSAA